MPDSRPPEIAPRGARLFYQIALRLLAVTAIFMVLEILIVVAMYVHDEDTLGEDLISLESQRIAELVHERRTNPASTPVFADAAARAVSVFDERGALVLSENPGHMPLPEAPHADLHALTAHEQREGQYFISGIRRIEIDGDPLWVVLAISGRGLQPLLPALYKEVVDHALLPLIPLSLLLLVFNVAMVRRMLTPLERAMRDVEALDPNSMDRRLQVPESPVEVRSLLSAVNRALGRLERTMSTLRQFTADAAHELRTPLAVMTLTIDRLPASAETRKLREDVAAMSRLIAQMLDLARADALQDMGESQADPHLLASNLAAEMAPLAFSRGKRLSYVNHGSPPVQGQSELLERALRNLIENALTHTAPDTEVELSVGPGPRISVRDHGPGIPAQLRDQVFDRFWRVDRRLSGAGLGLAIARNIMAACGGEVRISDADGGGAMVSLELLAAPPQS